MNIDIKNVTKSFGTKKVLENINLDLESGNLYCVIGRNGVGKTTLFQALLQLIEVESGEVLYDGRAYNHLPIELKQRIGFSGDNSFLIEELTAVQYLSFISKLYGLPSSEAKNRITDIIKYLFDDVNDLNKKSIKAYSTGMKKKLSLGASILHTPDCLIWDEPFAGLDPIASQQIIELLSNFRKSNRTIVISSHDIEYIEALQGTIIILDEGKILFNGKSTEFTEKQKTLNQSVIEILKPKSSEKLSWI
jgi:ABC-2 type transport system ATP-binding protein